MPVINPFPYFKPSLKTPKVPLCVEYKGRYTLSPASASRRGILNKHPPSLSDLPGEGNHLAQSAIVTRLRLGELHVRTLKALVEDIHDLGCNVANVWVLLSVKSVSSFQINGK